MKIKALLFLFLGSLLCSSAEKLVKVDGTFGKYEDIVVNSKGRWYIVHNSSLCTSTDKGVTRTEIELPSGKLVRSSLGIDNLDNLYVQDLDFKLFRVIQSEKGTFLSEEIFLPHILKSLISRPFFLDNTVYSATKIGLVTIDTQARTAEEIKVPPYDKVEFTQMVPFAYINNFDLNEWGIVYSGGGNTHWIYRKDDFGETLICQTASSVKRMNSANGRIFYTINGVNEVYVLQIADYSVLPPTVIEGIDASPVTSENDFVVHSPKHDNKTYIYMNVDSKGTVYGLDEKKVDNKTVVEVVSKHQLDNKFASIECAVFDNDGIYFGTADGVYKLTDIKPKSFIE